MNMLGALGRVLPVSPGNDAFSCGSIQLFGFVYGGARTALKANIAAAFDDERGMPHRVYAFVAGAMDDGFSGKHFLEHSGCGIIRLIVYVVTMLGGGGSWGDAELER